MMFGVATWSNGEAPFRHRCPGYAAARSEEHTSEIQSPMRNSYAVFCLKKKKKKKKLPMHRTRSKKPNAHTSKTIITKTTNDNTTTHIYRHEQSKIYKQHNH